MAEFFFFALCKGYKKDIFGGVLTGFELNDYLIHLTLSNHQLDSQDVQSVHQ